MRERRGGTESRDNRSCLLVWMADSPPAEERWELLLPNASKRGGCFSPSPVLSPWPPPTYLPLPLLPAPIIFFCCNLCLHIYFFFCLKLAISFIPVSVSVLASISVSSQPHSSLRISSRFFISCPSIRLSFCALIFTLYLLAAMNQDLYPQFSLLFRVCVCVCETIPTYRLRMTSSFYSAANQRQAHGALPSEECYVHKRDGERNRDGNRYAM